MAASKGTPKQGPHKPRRTRPSQPTSGLTRPAAQRRTKPAKPGSAAAKGGGAAAKSSSAKKKTSAAKQSSAKSAAAKSMSIRRKPAKKPSAKRTPRAGTFAARIADRRQLSRAQRSLARLTARWKGGSVVERVAMATVGVLAAAVAIALVVAVVHVVSGRVELSEAKARQVELTETYDFDPGDIISDEQFFDGDAMDEAQVQAFLDEQGAACTKDSCLRARRFKVERRAANDYCREYPGARHGQSAAAIITAASKACDVSPKVLLTMLQKEQQLVTETNPKDFQFRSAMGLSCPDDDHCDPEYAGFFRQVFGSAERYQYYVHHEDRYDFHAGRLNFVRFSPDVSCGGANVYIENKATALLYIYTPYQPNDAALAAGAGEGDACSTYGNRNFSIIYSNWFGDPRKA